MAELRGANMTPARLIKLIDQFGVADLSRAAKVNERTVHRYKAAGQIPETAEGQRVAYCLLTRQGATVQGDTTATDTKAVDDVLDRARQSKIIHEAQIMQQRARKARLENDIAEGNVVSIKAFNRCMLSHARHWRQGADTIRRAVEEVVPAGCRPLVVQVLDSNLESVRKVLMAD